jgi:hypothetical protein
VLPACVLGQTEPGSHSVAEHPPVGIWVEVADSSIAHAGAIQPVVLQRAAVLRQADVVGGQTGGGLQQWSIASSSQTTST